MDDFNKKKNMKELKIKIDDKKLPGSYSNQAIIMHSKDEFIIDFIAAIPPEPSVVGRVIMTPGHFKRIAYAMKENLENYEKQFGEIEISVDPITTTEQQSVH